MELKTPIRDWAMALQKRLACELASSGSIIDHNVSIGTIRETIVRDILRAFLPASLEIGTGQIVDLKGSLSKQVDVVIARGDAPAFRFPGGLSAFMIETVLATVEVKSAGYADMLQEALANCNSVKNLHYGINTRGKGMRIFDDAFQWIEKSGGLTHVEVMISAPSMKRSLDCPSNIWFILPFVRFWMHWEAGHFTNADVLKTLAESMSTPEFDFFSNLLCFQLKADDVGKVLTERFSEAPQIKEDFLARLYELLLYDQLVPATFVLAYQGFKDAHSMVLAVKEWFGKNREHSSWVNLPRVILNDRIFMYRHYNEYHCATHDCPVIFLIVGILNALAADMSWQVAPGAVAQINRYFDILQTLGEGHPIYGKEYFVWSIPMDDSSEGKIIQMNKQ